MNSLEFINEKIEMHNIGIDSAVKIIKEFDGILPVESYKKLVEEHLKEIQILEQIKAELEAWEVVKPSIHHIKEQRCFVIHNIYRNEQYDFIMKGLEI